MSLFTEHVMRCKYNNCQHSADVCIKYEDASVVEYCFEHAKIVWYDILANGVSCASFRI